MLEQRHALLDRLYGGENAAAVNADIEGILATHRRVRRAERLWSERDAWLITYPDQFQVSGEASLATLRAFYQRHLAELLNGVHVLPFYPWSSDDGFSVIDYQEVDPRYGTWEDIEALAGEARLMVDAVLNHMSAGSPWFRSFLEGEPGFESFFRTADPDGDLSAVVRPRTSPLLTRFEAPGGSRWVWTTFSADQVDLNYADPRVFLRMLEVLLSYARHGARIIRLDAVGFLWKEEGTSCLHHEKTHDLIRLFRNCLDAGYPDVLLIAEANVPHEDNVTYFGESSRPEAHMVYQFPLAPLVLDAFVSGNASALVGWLQSIDPPPPGTSYFNFLASHDGVGVRPAGPVIGRAGIDRLAEHAITAGGRVSGASRPDGTTEPYELNATWFDLMAHGHDEASARDRHLASHAIQLALQGVPGIYVHSLFGTPNDYHGYEETGIPRTLNRKRFDRVGELERMLDDPNDRATQILEALRSMLRWRAATPAFHPEATQRVLDTPPPLVAIERRAENGTAARVLVNVSANVVDISPWFDGLMPLGPAPRPARLRPWTSIWLIEAGSRPAPPPRNGQW